MADVKNIDDLIVKSMNPQQSQPVPQIQPEPNQSVDQSSLVKEDEPHSIDTSAAQGEQDTNVPQRTLDQPTDSKPVISQQEDKSIDEYGNPVEKPKLYSDEDVQRMINERLSRVRHQEPQSQPKMPPPTQQQTDEPNWQEELERFVETTLEKKQRKIAEDQWRQQEAQKQADFEAKFSSGMNKYSDFHQVVANKPITDSMMLATRSLDNPAAFLYGAAKLHAPELERISRIADPYMQASEIGRLHEKMVKARAAVSNASKPLEQPKGDMAIPQIQQPSLEQRIDTYAKQKRK